MRDTDIAYQRDFNYGYVEGRNSLMKQMTDILACEVRPIYIQFPCKDCPHMGELLKNEKV